MSSPAAMPPLPLDEWEATKDTLHLYAQVVGKVRMACTAPQNHWWNAPLYVSARGLTTRRMIWDGLSFEIDFDLIDHELVIRTDQGDVDSFALLDGLSVARFHAELMTTLERRGIRPMIRPEPFGVPMNTPFAEDSEHASYDPEYVHRLWRILLAVEAVFVEWAGWFTGKQSPVHLFWHSFDLALARFSGTRAPEREGVDRVTAESYSHEVISCGFWPGDASMRGPAFYSYTAPEPPRLTEQLLRPGDASRAESPCCRTRSCARRGCPCARRCCRSCRRRTRREPSPPAGIAPSSRLQRCRPSGVSSPPQASSTAEASHRRCNISSCQPTIVELE